LHFFIFDLLMLKGKDVMSESLVKRRELIEKHVLPKLADPIRYSPILDGSLDLRAGSLYDAAHIYVCHTKEHPEKGLPRPTLATAFEVVIDGKEKRFSGGS
jgi:hypothetical protein